MQNHSRFDDSDRGAAPLLAQTAQRAILQQADDAALVQACLAGDEEAWEVLLARYSKLIYAIPFRFDLPRHIADEIFQEVCVILLNKLPTLQDQTRLGSWLMTITKRLCLQLRTKHQNVTSLDAMEELLVVADETEAMLLQNEEYAVVRQALANLDSRSQWLLQALFFTEEPPSYLLLAQELGVPPGAIGPMRTRCLKKLQAEIRRLEAVGAPVASAE